VSGSGRLVEIMLIEDNPGDVRLVKEALADSKILNNLHVAMDGEQALKMLRSEGFKPDLIFLDLNLPRLDGYEVLNVIKDDPDLRLIPVVVLTSSRSEADVIRSYERYANCFINKPLDMNQFVEVVRSVQNFWFSIVTLPEKSD
jgi:chemotaxis family two-component system response regulator Rcp1